MQHRDNRLAFGLHLDGVIKSADANVGAPADKRLQRPRAALDIGDLDIETSLLEIAETFGDREWQLKDR